MSEKDDLLNEAASLLADTDLLAHTLLASGPGIFNPRALLIIKMRSLATAAVQQSRLSLAIGEDRTARHVAPIIRGVDPNNPLRNGTISFIYQGSDFMALEMAPTKFHEPRYRVDDQNKVSSLKNGEWGRLGILRSRLLSMQLDSYAVSPFDVDPFTLGVR